MREFKVGRAQSLEAAFQVVLAYLLLSSWIGSFGFHDLESIELVRLSQRVFFKRSIDVNFSQCMVSLLSPCSGYMGQEKAQALNTLNASPSLGAQVLSALTSS